MSLDTFLLCCTSVQLCAFAVFLDICLYFLYLLCVLHNCLHFIYVGFL